MENNYMWIFSESNEGWYTDSIFACSRNKESAQKIWDELKQREGAGGSVFEYTAIDIVNCRVLKTVGRHQNTAPAEYILEN